MIPVSISILDSKATLTDDSTQNNWQQELSQGLRSAAELLSFLGIDERQLPYQVDHTNPFKTRIPRRFAELINADNAYDPILLQTLPRAEEQQVTQHFSQDPLKEQSFTVHPGLIHKYHNRVLLIAHQACAIHCRYCFRRHFPYSEQRLTEAALKQAISYIQSKPEINEVILSGGDPLNLNDDKLIAIISSLEQLPQLKTLRIHTRTPVTLPSRLTELLSKRLKQCSKNVVIVFHINHANELSADFCQAVKKLDSYNIQLLNQTVLLKDINDNAKTLIKLSEDLFANGIMPYYLHQLDAVAGAAHFQVSTRQANRIWHELQKGVSGYLLPRLVQEIPDQPSKSWVNELTL